MAFHATSFLSLIGMLQIKGLKCLRPEEGDGYQSAMVFYDDKGTAEPLHKAEPRLRADVVSSALKVVLCNSAFLCQLALLSVQFLVLLIIHSTRCTAKLTVLPPDMHLSQYAPVMLYTTVRATHTFWNCACSADCAVLT